MTIESISVRPVAASALDVETVGVSQHSVVAVLVAVAKGTRALLGLRLATIGFHNGQDEFLLALEDHEPVCISTLSERLGVRPSTVSKMTDRLVERDLVKRVADKRDSRRTMVQITPAGIAAKAVIRSVHDDLEEELLHDMRRDETATMRTGLIIAHNRLNARLVRLR